MVIHTLLRHIHFHATVYLPNLQFQFFISLRFTQTLLCRRGYRLEFAYYISGTRGDADRIFRLLLAVYHPRNRGKLTDLEKQVSLS
ncbi:hypothetical protein L1987_12836 [Smallanthus sonchifolius]|uniref:Uncharacterized protein n=1 Tax=Smallanthus sonchifolius TaxID=185202 RepID=A0ACB9JFA4_9ASTR|nr:hypothetical protein L1987_12836 [Smallanthus sonchifolius]